ncbi:MAG: hypothetical protein R3F41_00885 [Gammaproteobacteria bacterium]|nr:hypothetical protein [Pseudomonadales bacterium]MCP5346133.1 hypothetical protein [Pseudomonadales bacterium]
MNRTITLFALLVTLIFSGASARAAEEYTDSVPAGLLHLLMDFYGQGNFAVYDGILDEFPDFDLPDEFQVAGSMRQSTSMRVALQTDLDEATAVPLIVNEFVTNNWIEMPVIRPPMQDTGFISPNDPRRQQHDSIRLCHDRQGNVSVDYVQRENEAHVMLSANSGLALFMDRPRSCAEQIEQIQQSLTMRSLRGGPALAQYMPRMELPASDTNFYRPVRVGGFSSSSQETETEASIVIDWDIEALYEHFAGQINTQDWTQDSSSVGDVSAIGTWTKDTAGSAPLVGTLSILASDDDFYELKFAIRSQGGSGGRSPFFPPPR